MINFYVSLSFSYFNMHDCTVFCDMLVALVALFHLYEINIVNVRCITLKMTEAKFMRFSVESN